MIVQRKNSINANSHISDTEKKDIQVDDNLSSGPLPSCSGEEKNLSRRNSIPHQPSIVDALSVPENQKGNIQSIPLNLSDEKILNDLKLHVTRCLPLDSNHRYILFKYFLENFPYEGSVDENLNKILRFWEFNKEILRNPAVISFHSGFSNNEILVYSDTFLSDRLPLFIEFFNDFKDIKGKNNLVCNFSLFILNNIGTRMLNPLHIHSKMVFPILSCCLLTCPNNLEFGKKAIQRLFYKDYSLNHIANDLLMHKFFFIYDCFHVWSCFLEILENALDQDGKTVELITEWTILLSEEWQKVLCVFEPIKKEFDHIQDVKTLSCPDLRYRLTYIVTCAEKIKIDMYNILMTIYQVHKFPVYS